MTIIKILIMLTGAPKWPKYDILLAACIYTIYHNKIIVIFHNIFFLFCSFLHSSNKATTTVLNKNRIGKSFFVRQTKKNKSPNRGNTFCSVKIIKFSQ